MDNAVPLPPDFAAMAAKFPNTVKRLLVDGVDPSSVSVHELLSELRLDPSKHLLLGEELEEHIMRIPDALSSVACAALRAAVDDESNRSVKKDSVDGGAEHEIVLDLASLTALVGNAVARELCILPTKYKRWQAGESRPPSTPKSRQRPPVPSIPREVFVRRYSGDTRPWIPFHADAAAVTINIALESSGTHEGGSLVAVANGRVQTIDRGEGEATIHDSRLLHAVTRMRGTGVRYSLIL